MVEPSERLKSQEYRVDLYVRFHILHTQSFSLLYYIQQAQHMLNLDFICLHSNQHLRSILKYLDSKHDHHRILSFV